MRRRRQGALFTVGRRSPVLRPMQQSRMERSPLPLAPLHCVLLREQAGGAGLNASRPAPNSIGIAGGPTLGPSAPPMREMQTSNNPPVARRCASVNRSAGWPTGAHEMFARSQRRATSCCGSFTSTSLSTGINQGRSCPRITLVTRRGSAASSCSPNSSVKQARCWSLVTPMKSSPPQRSRTPRRWPRRPVAPALASRSRSYRPCACSSGTLRSRTVRC